MELEPGQLVYSKAGRDKGLAFVIIAAKGEYLYLADGRLRLAAKPKKKKVKHVMPTKYVDLAVKEALSENRIVLDSDLRKLTQRDWPSEG